jgi:hypothetical protein
MIGRRRVDRLPELSPVSLSLLLSSLVFLMNGLLLKLPTHSSGVSIVTNIFAVRSTFVLAFLYHQLIQSFEYG